ncbi:MAG: pilus assembly protein TadG-related protein [Pseudomonadota bacterium]
MRHLGRFLKDETGSVTAWNLIWFAAICGIIGVTIDTTTAHHTKAQLQITADAAAHAAMIGLLNPNFDIPAAERVAAAVTAGRSYSYLNMPAELYGDVTVDRDIEVGLWHDRVLVENQEYPDAVKVTAWRSDHRDNSVGASFLRIIGFNEWNLNASAVATADLDGVADCRWTGLIAGSQVIQSSSNHFFNEICLHGEEGLNINTGNLIECSTVISNPEVEYGIRGPWAGQVTEEDRCEAKNPRSHPEKTMLQHALQSQTLRSTALTEYLQMATILQSRVDGTYSEVIDPFEQLPSYITRTQVVRADMFDSTILRSGTLYNVICSDESQIRIAGVIHNIGILTNCPIEFAAPEPVADEPGDAEAAPDDPEAPLVTSYEAFNEDGGSEGVYTATQGTETILDSVVIHSSADIGAPFTFTAPVQIGRDDNCALGGGATLYGIGEIATPADASLYGAQIVAVGNVDLGARADSILGINVEADGNINISAEGRIGACSDVSSDAIYTVRDFELRLVD